MNKEIGRSFFKMGAVILAIVLLIFGFKSLFGYTKVEKVGTLSGCRVSTRMDTKETKRRRHGHGARTKHEYHIYYVTVTYEAEKSEVSSDLYAKFGIDPNSPDSIDGKTMKYVIFYRSVEKGFYERFSTFGTDTITFFKTKEGTVFPVYKYDSTEREAEKVYRDIDPPYFWYWVYNIGLGLAGICFILGFSGRRTAKNYSTDNAIVTTVDYNDFDKFHR